MTENEPAENCSSELSGADEQLPAEANLMDKMCYQATLYNRKKTKHAKEKEKWQLHFLCAQSHEIFETTETIWQEAEDSF